jgi:hypothetical protein
MDWGRSNGYILLDLVVPNHALGKKYAFGHAHQIHPRLEQFDLTSSTLVSLPQ